MGDDTAFPTHRNDILRSTPTSGGVCLRVFLHLPKTHLSDNRKRDGIKVTQDCNLEIKLLKSVMFFPGNGNSRCDFPPMR